jgi:hypothetical protein
VVRWSDCNYSGRAISSWLVEFLLRLSALNLYAWLYDFVVVLGVLDMLSLFWIGKYATAIAETNFCE